MSAFRHQDVKLLLLLIFLPTSQPSQGPGPPQMGTRKQEPHPFRVWSIQGAVGSWGHSAT